MTIPDDWQSTLERMRLALNAGDVDRSVACFTQDAVVTIEPAPPDEPGEYRGHEAIRGWFRSLVEEHFRIELEPLAIDGNTIVTQTTTSHDRTRRLGVAPLVGTESYRFRDGLIEHLRYEFSPEDLTRIADALAKMEAGEP